MRWFEPSTAYHPRYLPFPPRCDRDPAPSPARPRARCFAVRWPAHAGTSVWRRPGSADQQEAGCPATARTAGPSSTMRRSSAGRAGLASSTARSQSSIFHTVTVPLSDVYEMTLTSQEDRQRAGRAGFAVGMVPGMMAGAKWGYFASGCWSDGPCNKFTTVVSALAGGLIVGGLAAAVATATGSGNYTTYRFNGGSVSASPGGASVTIDLGR